MESQLKWSSVHKYTITRKENESKTDFHTRVANEIRAMECKIVQADFDATDCTIWYMNRIQD